MANYRLTKLFFCTTLGLNFSVYSADKDIIRFAVGIIAGYCAVKAFKKTETALQEALSFKIQAQGVALRISAQIEASGIKEKINKLKEQWRQKQNTQDLSFEERQHRLAARKREIVLYQFGPVLGWGALTLILGGVSAYSILKAIQ